MDRIWETGGISDLGIIPTGYERTLPPEVQLVVRARRRALLRSGRGRVLDLGGADAHRTLWASVPGLDSVTVLDGVADARLADLVEAGERFDTVASVFQLAGAPHLDVTLGHVRSLLADTGQVLFLEPARLVGVAGRVQRAVGPPIGALTGWRPDRDVPMALREGGLSVTSIRRHRVPTLQWWLRQVVEGRAHHRLVPGGAQPEASTDG